MKRSLCTILILVAVFSSWGLSGAESVKSIEADFLQTLPEVKSHKLNNGVNIIYLKNELPVTVIYASISYGRMYENAQTAGTAEVLNKTLSLSGSVSYPGNLINEKLESVGGHLKITAGWETTVIEVKVLSRHTALAFSILGDLLKNPVFDEKGISTARKLTLERIKRDLDDPEETGVQKLREIIFSGEGYGSVHTQQSINSITPDTLKSLWKRFVTGENLHIAVSSSEDEKGILAAASSEFTSIAKGKRELYSIDSNRIISSVKSSSHTIYLIPMELEQASIYTGTLAPGIRYDGNYALYLMNYILGGGSFNSRLMNEIRVKRGLAYSVYSLVRNRRDAGIFISFAQTRSESVPEVVTLMYDNIRKIYSERISDEELGWAKESVKNSYVFRFNTVDDLLGNFLEIQYNNLESDYFKKYLERINNVTPAAISDEGGKMFSYGFVTVVVGSRNLEKTLSKIGKVVICEQQRGESK